ncbi:NAD(P)-dependent oxidoreductase [Candidatus Falkowbacteria bacterium]|nr:NAD(P)-dependent oxidoreductase [Patescibacteria group bacterium]MDD3435162.1 NAD(P)-dependent oxidoreductase [Patescibacteria group bacterium]MDD4466303.1 NAD(P)-dependent oxidoreductase [Patescibacteria group bacterium]NCU42779.1 NAD(P)-dependent oxidoreductase [Candidatus Falkowbacteria bacterium]
MKILIIGSRGALGQQLSKVFSQGDDDLFAWDFPEFNLTDFKSLRARLESLRPDLIINAAAYNAVDKCEQDLIEKELAFVLNEALPKTLADFTVDTQAILIHYSTDYVFSGDGQQKLDETARPNPLNNYGVSKAAGEKVLSDKLNLKYYLIRTSKLFGPKSDSPFAKNSFFALMKKLSFEQASLKVVNDEKGCFTYTPDLAQATFTLLKENYPFGIYHLVNPPAATWYDGVLALKELADLKVEILPIPGSSLERPAKRPYDSTLINTKFPALRDYREALKEYLINFL